MANEKFVALIKRAQEIDQACKANSAAMEALKSELAEFKKNAGGGATKKKGFWEELLGGGDEKENDNEED